jgi:ABC-2 type transport system permease protein
MVSRVGSIAAVRHLGAEISGLGALSGDNWAMLARQLALGVMSAALTLPIAWVATLSRSVLGGVSAAIGLVVVAQVSVLASLGGWIPLAAPALWAVSAGAEVSPVQLLLLVPFAGASVLASALAWRRMQLDR